MERSDILDFARSHPGAIHVDGDRFVELVEREVRRHVEAEAWSHARREIERRLAELVPERGLPASEEFVAREVCHELARDLRHDEPHVEPGSEERLAGPVAMGEVEPEARELVRRFVHDLAEQLEHRVWQDIVRRADHRGRELVREHKVSSELRWDMSRRYSMTAERVLRMLAEECAQQERACSDEGGTRT